MLAPRVFMLLDPRFHGDDKEEDGGDIKECEGNIEDLTQMTWELSREDAAPITQVYKTLGISDLRLWILMAWVSCCVPASGQKKPTPLLKSAFTAPSNTKRKATY